MTKIDWTDEAKLVFKAFARTARTEFRASTARKWLSERKSIEWLWNVIRHPIHQKVFCATKKNATENAT